jgi:hypothetical protein
MVNVNKNIKKIILQSVKFILALVSCFSEMQFKLV